MPLFEVLTDNWGELRDGFWVTVRLVAGSFLLAMALGTAVASLRIAPNVWLQRLGGVYVETFRNVPLLVLLFISYAGLRRAGVDIGPWTAGIASLGLYTSAYVAEVLRSGVFSVGKGQIEASLSLGFSYAETLRRIVLPQAFRTVISPLASVTIAMIKNSAIIGVSLLALGDLLKTARIIQSRTFETDATFFWAAVGYLLLTVAVTLPRAGWRSATRSRDELPLRPRQLGVADDGQQRPLHPRGLPDQHRDRRHRDHLRADRRAGAGAAAHVAPGRRCASSPASGSTSSATCR